MSDKLKEFEEKSRYLAVMNSHGESEEFDTIEEAREWLRDELSDPEGFPDDVEFNAIYEMKERVMLDEVKNRDDYTQEEWEEVGYGDFDCVAKLKFKEVIKESN